MELYVTLGLIALTIVVGMMLAYGGANAWRNLMRDDDAPLALFRMLGQRGLTPEQLENAVGPEALALAVQRCTLCFSVEECRDRAAAGRCVPEHCPNARFFAHASPPCA
jgi:hypothetical protein